MISTAGFLEPSEGLFTVGTPVFSVNGAPVGDSEIVEGWDYSTALGLSWQVEVDKVRLLRECGLETSSDIRIGFRWKSAKTTLFESSIVSLLAQGRNEISVEIPSELTGGQLDISIFVLVMSGPGQRRNPLAASLPGSILWSETRRVFLEGVGSRFPLVAVDFPAGEMQRGMWEFAPESNDLEASAMGSFVLRVNSSHPSVRKLLDKPAAPESRVLLAAMKADLNRQLIAWALREGPKISFFDDDTIGGVLWATFNRYFDKSDFDEMSNSMESSPWRVEARIQAVTSEAVK